MKVLLVTNTPTELNYLSKPVDNENSTLTRIDLLTGLHSYILVNMFKRMRQAYVSVY